METPKHQFNTRICTSPVDTSATSATVSVVKLPVRTARTDPSPEALDMGRNRPRLPSAAAGLKPFADGIRNAPPFGLPKCEGQHERTRRSTGGVASSQVDPPPRRNRCPCPSTSALAGSFAASVYVPPPAALREVRLNGFPGALAEVPRHRIGGHRRVPEAVPTGSSSVANVGEQHTLGITQGLARDSAPSNPNSPALRWIARAGASPPFPP